MNNFYTINKAHAQAHLIKRIDKLAGGHTRITTWERPNETIYYISFYEGDCCLQIFIPTRVTMPVRDHFGLITIKANRFIEDDLLRFFTLEETLELLGLVWDTLNTRKNQAGKETIESIITLLETCKTIKAERGLT